MAPPGPGPADEPGHETMTISFTRNRNDAGQSRQGSRSPHYTREPTKRLERPTSITEKGAAKPPSICPAGPAPRDPADW